MIVTWNSERWIVRCLQSLQIACAGLDYEVVLHDNGSTDDTVRSAAATMEDGRLVLLAASGNEGFARGVNEAVRRSRGSWILLLNPDTIVAPDSIHVLIAATRAASVRVLVPMLTDLEGVPQHDFQLRKLPTIPTILANLLLIERLMPSNRITARGRYPEGELEDRSVVEQPAAAAMLLRRDVFDEVGPFDERFTPAWFEDVDFCHRLHDLKIPILFVPAARILHAGGASLEHVPPGTFLSIWYRNQFRYVEKWFPDGVIEVVRWAIIAGSLLRAVASLAGLSMRGLGRLAAAGAYMRVAREAFQRWPPV